jgi:hypothetical protein
MKKPQTPIILPVALYESKTWFLMFGNKQHLKTSEQIVTNKYVHTENRKYQRIDRNFVIKSFIM